MGKLWDAEVPSVEFWSEVFRVLKPGGHVLSFGGTRTYHRMVVNIEDAGFEIRDQIQWLYSTGFPKSLNIQKQLEKNEYIQCECSKQNTEYDLRQLPEANISQTINIESEQGETLLQNLYEQNIQRTFQGDIKGNESEKSNEIREKSSLEGGYNTIQEKGELQGCYIQESTTTSKRNGEEGWVHNGAQNSNGRNGWENTEQNGSGTSYRPQPEQQSPEQFGTMANERATQKSRSGSVCNRCGKSIVSWEGWGSALKPANEPICLARKPLSEKSIAENVLKWKTGGINVDGCRIGIVGKDDRSVGKRTCNIFDEIKVSGGIDSPEYIPDENGRFPANLILDESAAEMLDEQSGVSKSIKSKRGGSIDSSEGRYNWNNGESKSIEKYDCGFNDQGGASRFFYVAKVSKSERNMGLDEGVKSNHPTVKPVNLMSYLCKLITPPNGIVLDPFMGSGSTGIAALLNDFRFVGMEMDNDYFKIAEARINSYEDYRKFIKK